MKLPINKFHPKRRVEIDYEDTDFFRDNFPNPDKISDHAFDIGIIDCFSEDDYNKIYFKDIFLHLVY